MKVGLCALVSVAVMCAFAPRSSPAATYLPLALGNEWTYSGLQGADETQTVVGTTDLWGTEVSVIRFQNSVFNENLTNFWTSSPDGAVDCWGFYLGDEQSGVLYRPPIRIVEGPLYVGKQWSQTVHYYNLPDTTYSGAFEIAFQVYEEGILAVPAGEFHCFGIGQALPPAMPAGFPTDRAIDGRHVLDRGWVATSWWSKDIGEAQYWSDQIYQLVSFNSPTPVQSSSWGRIKALYSDRSR